MPAHDVMRLLCSHLSRMFQKRLQHATGNLAQPVTNFSGQLPIISIVCSVISLYGSFWTPFTVYCSPAHTVAGQRRIRTGLRFTLGARANPGPFRLATKAPPTTSRAISATRSLRSRTMRPVFNVAVLAAAAAVAVALVVTRRPSRPPAPEGSWQPVDPPGR